VLWAKANPQKALDSLMAQPAYGRLSKDLIQRMSERYLFWPKPTVYYPFDDPNGLWPKEESRISEWAFSTGASKTKVTSADWESVRKTSYMATTFGKLGWKVPARPPILPKDFGGVEPPVQALCGRDTDRTGAVPRAR
jgi:hypothetical protein